MNKNLGPTYPFSEETHADKYRSPGESFKDYASRVANALKDNDEHFKLLYPILLEQKFLPAGRIQASMGSPRETTPYNCFVSGVVEDNSDSIMDRAKEAFQTMRLGGGIGYDFSNIRPRGDLIRTLQSRSSGPVSFMNIYDAVCATIASAGHRRGAQMGVLRVDHPDIEEFIHAKNNGMALRNFNISVGVTDTFMEAVKNKTSFDLVFEGRVYRTVDANALWESILRSTWDWAEPGVLFIDRINKKNNLWYCETISATNPCAEQPLPPHGACLLGSFNLTKYVEDTDNGQEFRYDTFKQDIRVVVRAMDNVVDRAVYPLPEQKKEAQSKRRMGLGVTGLANAIELMGYPYGSPWFLAYTEAILKTLRDTAYEASIELAKEKGPFPLFDTKMLDSAFAKTLPQSIRKDIECFGIRNSHLLSIAPTGTISICADNVSSGLEPVFSHSYNRRVKTVDGEKTEAVEDWAYRVHGVKGVTADELSVDKHVAVLNLASVYVDSACSKTCNVGPDVSWEEFKDVYMKAYDGGASGCTTFRSAGKLMGVLSTKDEEPEDSSPKVTEDFIDEGLACYFDPETGRKACE